MTRHRLSPHFTIEEFDCHDAFRTQVPKAAIPALEELCVNMLEPLRAKYGPCKVLSGYRTRAYNATLPGAALHSQHIYDDQPSSVAADLRFAKGSVAQWAWSARWRFNTKNIWRKRQRGGSGRYLRSGFTHVDSGPRRNWEG
jgi:uncharacterized protein YcbK (DUF882 family)